jgi:hypothetical protein
VLIAVPGKTRRRRLTITNRSSRTDWFPAFLEMFPSPHMICAMTEEDFSTAAWEAVGRKVGQWT